MGRSVFSLIGLIVALAGIGLFTGIAIGVWVIKQEADQQIVVAADRARDSVQVADRALGLVREVIGKAETNLAAARLAAADDEPVNPVLRVFARHATRDLPGGIDRTRDAIGTASDVLIVADATLDVLEREPGDAETLGLGPTRLQAARTQLSVAAGHLRTTGQVLGAEQTATVQLALNEANTVTGDLDAALSRARTKVELIKQKAKTWTLRLAIAITAASVLAAVGQFFMARACWYGLRRETV